MEAVASYKIYISDADGWRILRYGETITFSDLERQLFCYLCEHEGEKLYIEDVKQKLKWFPDPETKYDKLSQTLRQLREALTGNTTGTEMLVDNTPVLSVIKPDGKRKYISLCIMRDMPGVYFRVGDRPVIDNPPEGTLSPSPASPIAQPGYSPQTVWQEQYRDAMKTRYSAFPVMAFTPRELTVDAAAEARMVPQQESLQQSKADAQAADPMQMLADAPQMRQPQQDPQLVAKVLETLARDGKPRHVTLLGKPGDGKSTLLHKLCIAFTDAGKCPLFLTAPQCESLRSLQDYITSGACLHDIGPPPEFGSVLWEMAQKGDAPILVDGLDEANDRVRVRALLSNFASGAGRNAVIVVTCRKAVYQNLLAPFHTVELYPLEDKELKYYAGERLGVQAQTFLEILNADPRTKALAGNGLMLAMMAWLYKQGDFKPPVARDDLYERITTLFLEDPRRYDRALRVRLIDNQDLKSEALEEIAFHTYFCQGRNQEVKEGFALDCIRQVTRKEPRQRHQGDERAILTDLAQNAGLLAQDAAGMSSYRFFHPTFQEYFAARFLAARWKAGDIAYAGWLPSSEGWQERQSELRCPQCGCSWPSFWEMIFRLEYRELLLLFVGMLDSAEREQTFLDGISGDPLLIEGWRFDRQYRVQMDAEDDPHGIPDAAIDFVDHYVVRDRLFFLFAFVLEALCRCRHIHTDAVQRVFRGLKSVAWRRREEDALAVFRQARKRDNTAPIVAYYSQRLLEDGDYGIHYRAAEALGQIGQADERVITALVKALGNEDRWLRRRAAEALGQIGQAEERVIAALVKALKDGDYGVRSRAAEALGQIGQADERVIAALVKALKDGDYGVRSRATEALGQIGQADERVIAALVKALKDGDYGVRSRATEALGQIGQADERVIAALVKALEDGDDWLRRSAEEALVKLGQAEERVITALVKALEDRDDWVRGRAAEALGQIGQADERVITALVKALKDEDYSVCLRAAEALVKLGQADERVIAALVKALEDEVRWVRGRAAEALGQIGQAEERVIAALVKALTDRDDWVRGRAAEALGQIGQADERVIAALVKALTDRDDWVRDSAAEALGQIGQADERVIAALVKALEDEVRWVRDSAAEALGQIGQAEERVVAALVKALTDKYSGVRGRAAEALGQIGQAEERVVAALVKALTDRDDWVRDSAAEALGQISQAEERVIAALVKALTDKYSGVRDSAAEALGRIADARVVEPLAALAENRSIPEANRLDAIRLLIELEARLRRDRISNV
jgi:HEAT repeat protein